MKRYSTSERYFLARKTAKERLGLENEMTQADLAREIGVSRHAILNVEAGITANPKKDNRDKTAEVLRVSSEWLATGNGPMDQVLPDFELPDLKDFGLKSASPKKQKDSNNSYSYTAVAVETSQEDGKDWSCFYPEIAPDSGSIKTHIDPNLDIQKIMHQPIFRADAYVARDENNEPKIVYILKAYY